MRKVPSAAARGRIEILRHKIVARQQPPAESRAQQIRMIESNTGIDIRDDGTELPVVMAHAETASIADTSMVEVPSTVMVAALGVCRYHCRWRQGSHEQRIVGSECAKRR